MVCTHGPMETGLWKLEKTTLLARGCLSRQTMLGDTVGSRATALLNPDKTDKLVGHTWKCAKKTSEMSHDDQTREEKCYICQQYTEYIAKFSAEKDVFSSCC